MRWNFFSLPFETSFPEFRLSPRMQLLACSTRSTKIAVRGPRFEARKSWRSHEENCACSIERRVCSRIDGSYCSRQFRLTVSLHDGSHRAKWRSNHSSCSTRSARFVKALLPAPNSTCFNLRPRDLSGIRRVREYAERRIAEKKFIQNSTIRIIISF